MPELSPDVFVHPSADVEAEVSIGPGSTIWHLCQLRRGASVGAGCTLGREVFVDAGVRIGDRVKIQNYVSVYRGVELAEDVFVGPGAVFTNDLRPRARGEWRLVSTPVRQGASIGANATIVCGNEIGAHAMVAAGAVVTHPVAPHQLVAGNPARHRGWVCACGELISRDAVAPAVLECAGCAADRSGAAPAPIPLARVELGPEEETAVIEVLRSGQLAQGRRVAELEQAFARLHGVEHAVAVSSGTVALVAALQALGVRPGDEVVTTPFSFIATLNAILEVGARVRFADIRDDFTIDPDAMAALVNDRTAVLLPVHLYGLPAEMDPIAALAARQGLAIVEDAAQAVGACYRGRPVGSFGVGTFSLYATKNITSGEGGVLTTGDAAVADRLRLLRNQGMREAYRYELPGHNYRLTDLQAALVLPQLRRLAEIAAARAAHAAQLSEGLAGLPGLVLPTASPDRRHAWHQYTVRLTPEAPIDRDTFRARLAEAGVGSAVYYPRLMPDYGCYRDHPLVARDDTPRAARLCAEVVSLPVHPGLTDQEVGRTIAAVRTALGAN